MKVDWTIVLCALALEIFGAVIVGSMAPELAWSQVGFYLLGWILFLIFSRLDYHIYVSLWRHLYVLGLVLLVLTLLFGTESRGAFRWITIFNLRLQFSEVFKPFILASLAGFLCQSKSQGWKKFILAWGYCFLPIILILKQPDLGTAMVYLLAGGAMIFLSGARLKYFLFSGFLAVTFLPLFWRFLADYQKHRIVSFLDPAADPLGASYNSLQALIAVGSGMFLGRGLGRGSQSQLAFLPEHHTDFIFAALAEELGFVGASMVLVLYFLLIVRLFRLIRASADQFGALLAGGIGIIFLAQVGINAGMNLGIVPVTGITLPLISYGGSSILSTMIALGIWQNISSQSSDPKQTLLVV